MIYYGVRCYRTVTYGVAGRVIGDPDLTKAANGTCGVAAETVSYGTILALLLLCMVSFV